MSGAIRYWSAALVVVLCGLCLAAGEPAASAPDAAKADWPSFRGDAERSGVALSKLPEKLRQIWKYDAGEEINSTAAIVGERVYVGTGKGRLLALNLADGTMVWEFKAAGVISASPCVAGGRVFVGDETGNFFAVDAGTGKELWQIKARDKFVSSAVVEADAVLVGSYDRRLFCLEAASGKIRWTFKAEAQVHCSPAILREADGGAAVIAGCDKKLRAIDLTTGKERVAVDADDACAATPAIFKGHAYFGNLRGDVFDVTLKDGTIDWKIAGDNTEHPLGTISASAAVSDDAVFVATEDNLVLRVARETGKIQWVFTAREGVQSSPVLAGNRLFFGASDGCIYALSADAGKVMWKFVAGGQITASPAVGRGRLVIGTSEGGLYCFGE